MSVTRGSGAARARARRVSPCQGAVFELKQLLQKDAERCSPYGQ